MFAYIWFILFDQNMYVSMQIIASCSITNVDVSITDAMTMEIGKGQPTILGLIW